MKRHDAARRVVIELQSFTQDFGRGVGGLGRDLDYLLAIGGIRHKSIGLTENAREAKHSVAVGGSPLAAGGDDRELKNGYDL